MTKNPTLALSFRSFAVGLGIALLAGLVVIAPARADEDDDIECDYNPATEVSTCTHQGKLSACAMTSNPEDCEDFVEDDLPSSVIGDLRAKLAEPGRLIVVRPADGASGKDDDIVCWKVDEDNVECDSQSQIDKALSDCSINASCNEDQSGLPPPDVARNLLAYLAATSTEEKEEGCCDSCQGGYCRGCAPAPHSTCKEMDLDLVTCFTYGTILLCYPAGEGRSGDGIRLTATPPGNGGQSTPIPAMPEPSVPVPTDDVPTDDVPGAIPATPAPQSDGTASYD